MLEVIDIAVGVPMIARVGPFSLQHEPARSHSHAVSRSPRLGQRIRLAAVSCLLAAVYAAALLALRRDRALSTATIACPTIVVQIMAEAMPDSATGT